MKIKMLCLILLSHLALYQYIRAENPADSVPAELTSTRAFPLTIRDGEKFILTTPPTGFIPICWKCAVDALPNSIRLLGQEIPMQSGYGTIYTFMATKEATGQAIVFEGRMYGAGAPIETITYILTVEK